MSIEVKEISKRYGSQLAVSNVSFSVSTGEIVGFIGPNGAGKSTTMKIITGTLPPDNGSVLINDLPSVEKIKEIRRIIGYLPENPFFYDHLTAEETLRFGGRAANMEKEGLEERIDELLTRLNLLHVKKQPIRTYSKGMVQRLGLALALIHEPEICILDEPMSGLDPLGRRLVADLILDMRKMGKTVFFSSHILSDIESLCDRIGILNEGKLLFCGPLEDFVEESKGLEAAFIKVIETQRKVKE